MGRTRGVASRELRRGTPISGLPTLTPPGRRRVSRTLLRAQRYPRADVTRRPLRLRVTAHAVVTAALLVFAVIGTGSAPAGVAPPGTVPLLQVAAFSMPGLASSAPTTTVTRLESPAIPLTVVSSSVRQETLSLRPSDGTQQQQQQQTLTALRERNVVSAT